MNGFLRTQIVGLCILLIPILDTQGQPTNALESLDVLIPQLGAHTWKLREAAQKRLRGLAREHPQPVQNRLLHALKTTPDPEVNLRTRDLLRELVLECEFPAQRGFLGVSMREKDLNAGPGKAAIIVVNTVAKTVAEKNGIRAGDEIVKVDDHAVGPAFGMQKFSAYITSLGPNTPVTLVIRNVQGITTKTMKLGERPLLRGEPPLEQQKAAFFEKWLTEKLTPSRKP